MILALRLIRHTIALIFLISIANVCLLFGVVIRLFSEDGSWELACWTGNWFWTYMQNHWENNLHAKDAVEVSGDEIPEGESAFVISNHLGYSDYYLFQYLSSRAGMMGNSRYFVKKEILRIPFFGLAFWSMGMILVSRNWTNDQRLIEQAFQRIKTNEHPCWIVLCPEGTRRTNTKLLKSQAFAREKGKQELKHVLFPRTKGFLSTVQALRDSHIKYIYDLTLLYRSPGSEKNKWKVPSLAEQLNCKDLSRKGYKYKVHVKRIPISELPEDEDSLKVWCEILWKAKDDLLDSWMNNEYEGIRDVKIGIKGGKKLKGINGFDHHIGNGHLTF
ncbi:hypothetical protein I302_101336 [Kwoniella bestiolae CBS 10118]|uniref:Phospholipid/glycerol acyltransferase domain-containing protein n=1 Tax=Kwoniella bestiolae CBS 10118 TaxID=1296100 RepID=A0A1B9GBY5_9TREE|nr:hypothetical protein I302_00019 [Kwoniella bestiolae CBS 10118]OCF28532.1 hypothetical protein I302_00019 [Kwoniella bestiolae CBS 10118]